MARPTPQYMSSTSPTQDISLTPEHSQPSAPTQLLHSSSDNTHFGSSFGSLHHLSQSPFSPGLYRKPSQQFSNIDVDSQPDQEQQQGEGTLQRDLAYSINRHTDIQHGSKVSSHQPWTSVDAIISSMRPQPNNSMLRLEQTGRKPPTDSAYGSEQRSDQRLSSTQATYGSTLNSQNFPYDAPLGSTAEQNQILPDQQQHRPSSPIVIPPSPTTSSAVATETSPTASSNQSFRCEECSDPFSTKSELTKHMARHRKKFVCNYRGCARGREGQGFATKNDLDRHKANVHDDATVPKKSYRCCVQGCKDPVKFWNRKDNFKAHVIRMHPEEDANDIVERSLQNGSTPKVDEPSYAYSHLDPGSGHNQHLLQSSRAGTQFQSHSVSGQPEQVYDDDLGAPSTFGTGQDIGPSSWDDMEGDDLYGPSIPNNPAFTFGFSQPTTMNPNPYQDPDFSNPAMLRPQHTGASDFDSNTIMAPTTTTQPDNLPQILPRQMYGSFPPRMYAGDLQQIPPYGAQTAPIADHERDDIFQGNVNQWTDQFEQSPVTDTPIAKIDPSLQAGAWQPSSPYTTYAPPTEIHDQSLQANASSSEMQSNTGQTLNQHSADLRRKVAALLEKLSDSDLESTIEAYRRHPKVTDKERCTVKSALEKMAAEQSRPYKCSRDGCSKTFAKRNVCTKHEKRHDRSFFCTFDGCDKRFGSKHDLRRHERQIHRAESFHGWRCFTDDVPTSQHKPECFKFFDNEEEFKRHRKNEHRERAAGNGEGLRALKKCFVRQGYPGPFWCGFCNKVIANEPNGVDGTECDKTRYDHIDNHITKEKKRMQDWTDLKSEGLSKTQVMEQSRAPKNSSVPNDESDEEYDDVGEDDEDDEEYESPSAELSATIAGSIPQVSAHARQLLNIPPTSGTGRKRAHSQTDLPSQGGPNKFPKTTNYQSPRQAPHMSRGASDMAAAGPVPFGTDLNLLSTNQLITQCCRCQNRRPINGGLTCNNLMCMHAPCQECRFWNALGNRVYYRRHNGRQPESNN